MAKTLSHLSVKVSRAGGGIGSINHSTFASSQCSGRYTLRRGSSIVAERVACHSSIDYARVCVCKGSIYACVRVPIFSIMNEV